MEAVQETDFSGIQKIVLGVPGRCCALPLIRGLSDLPHIVLMRDSPAVIARRFRDNELDCALLPAIECLARTSDAALEPPQFKVIPGIGVCTEDEARTELLCTRGSLDEARRIGEDGNQGGMLAVARVVLAERCGQVPEFVDLEDGTADGALFSGDAAFSAECPFPVRHDLGMLWRELTGLPLVHMVWLVRRGAPMADLRRVLALALQEGLSAVDQIAVQAAEAAGIGVEAAHAYLGETLRYRMGGAEMEGLRKFAELAGKHGLCEPGAEVHLC